MTRHGLLLACAMAFAPIRAAAQSAVPAAMPEPRWLYEVSFGAGTRITSGTLQHLPSGASPLSSGRLVGSVGLDGGFQLNHQLALVAISEITAGGNRGAGTWGTVSLYGGGRWRPPGRIWLEGGAGVTALGYQPPSQISLGGTRLWSRAYEATAGVDLFRSPAFAMGVLARTSAGSFDGLTVRGFSVQLILTGWH